MLGTVFKTVGAERRSGSIPPAVRAYARTLTVPRHLSIPRGQVFFPGADQVLQRRIDEHTCVLLISQSGQTFPTLHATRKISRLVNDRLWLLTGCVSSKMEQAMIEHYRDHGVAYRGTSRSHQWRD